MPIYIQRCHGKRNLLLFKAIHQMQIFLVRVGVITAPPVTKGKAGEHRRFSADHIKCPHRIAIILTVSKYVKIQGLVGGGDQGAVAGQPKGRGVVDQCNPVFGANAVFQLESAAVSYVNLSVVAIQSPVGSQKVFAILQRQFFSIYYNTAFLPFA